MACTLRINQNESANYIVLYISAAANCDPVPGVPAAQVALCDLALAGVPILCYTKIGPLH
jgi:hypothetical protein